MNNKEFWHFYHSTEKGAKHWRINKGRSVSLLLLRHNVCNFLATNTKAGFLCDYCVDIPALSFKNTR